MNAIKDDPKTLYLDTFEAVDKSYLKPVLPVLP